jgi:hypothetical protein
MVHDFSGFQVDSETNKVLCLACKQATGNTNWIARASLSSHVKSIAHHKAVDAAQGQQELALEQHRQYTAIYGAAAVSLRNLPPVARPPSIGGFHSSDDMDLTGASATDDPLSFGEQQFLFPQHADLAIQEQSEVDLLRQEMHLLYLEALDEEFEGAEDQTVPAMAQEFQQLGIDIFYIPLLILRLDIYRNGWRRRGGRRCTASGIHWCPGEP